MLLYALCSIAVTDYILLFLYFPNYNSVSLTMPSWSSASSTKLFLYTQASRELCPKFLWSLMSQVNAWLLLIFNIVLLLHRVLIGFILVPGIEQSPWILIIKTLFLLAFSPPVTLLTLVLFFMVKDIQIHALKMNSFGINRHKLAAFKLQMTTSWGPTFNCSVQ